MYQREESQRAQSFGPGKWVFEIFNKWVYFFPQPLFLSFLPLPTFLMSQLLVFTCPIAVPPFGQSCSPGQPQPATIVSFPSLVVSLMVSGLRKGTPLATRVAQGSQVPRRAVCGTRGSLRTMHGGSSGRFLSKCLISSRFAVTAPWIGVLGPAPYASLQFFHLGSGGDNSLYTQSWWEE